MLMITVQRPVSLQQYATPSCAPVEYRLHIKLNEICILVPMADVRQLAPNGSSAAHTLPPTMASLLPPLARPMQKNEDLCQNRMMIRDRPNKEFEVLAVNERAGMRLHSKTVRIHLQFDQ